jgi:hypothetical protein
MDDAIIHALDLCALGDLQGAKSALEHAEGSIAERLALLITQLQENQTGRERAQKTGRHELGNVLSIAQANLEAMVDGVLEITPARLRDIRDSLRTAGALLVDLKAAPLADPELAKPPQRIDITELLAAQVGAVRGAADSKNVHIIEGDPQTLAREFRDALWEAVRRKPPGGKIEIIID